MGCIARENGGASLTAKKVVGRNLFDFIVDDVTLMYVAPSEETHARSLDEPVRRPYCCDTP
jgi:hypothetical protein